MGGPAAVITVRLPAPGVITVRLPTAQVITVRLPRRIGGLP